MVKDITQFGRKTSIQNHKRCYGSSEEEERKFRLGNSDVTEEVVSELDHKK